LILYTVNPSELEKLVFEAELNGDKTRIDGLLLGAIKGLKSNRTKPDPMAYLALLYLAKCKPECFDSNRVVEVYYDIRELIGEEREDDDHWKSAHYILNVLCIPVCPAETVLLSSSAMEFPVVLHCRCLFRHRCLTYSKFPFYLKQR
jgi:hypothetical protein